MNFVEPIRDPKKIVAIKKMLKGQENPRDYLLFVLGINSALRIGDLLRLKIEDVLDNQGNIAQHLYIKEQKTHKQKKVKLNDSAIEALKFYFNKEGSTNPEQPLFRSLRSQKILGRTMAWRLINDWCKDVGLTAQRYGTHTLRKTWAYMARRYKSVPLELIQHKLGHSTPSITRRYIGITSDEIENVENHVNL